MGVHFWARLGRPQKSNGVLLMSGFAYKELGDI
jgi:hypothetical protein